MNDSQDAPDRAICTDADLRTAIDAMCKVLLSVEQGDMSARVDLPYHEGDPIGALASCVNTMIALLIERREETASFQRELEGQIETIKKQRAAIHELSTPIIEVWPGVLCAPIVGVLDSARASEMTSALLNAVVETKASLAIIDITGIEAMDTQAADHFLRMARSVRLLGSDCALSGIHPNVARTIVHMGIDLADVASYRTLREALQHYVKVKKKRSSGKSARREEGRAANQASADQRTSG